MRFRCVKGMQDILPEQVPRWHELEVRFREMARLYRYAEIRTPILEPTALFAHSIGETTDVVEKEMFTFCRAEESLSLRPENTAGAARAYVEHSWHQREPVTRWYYLGPMFRAERPQRGRYRQFHQAGCEIYGDPGPACDAEMIDMLVRWLGELGLGQVEAHVSSLGGPAVKARYHELLREHLRPLASRLSEHARARLENNPLRVLDSKEQCDQQALEGAPSILDLLEGPDRAHWEGLCRALDVLGTPYVVSPRLVRGLDYYTRTVFELRATAGNLGAQNTLVGGGRYDHMIRSLGGPDVPALGFALGLERLLLALPERPVPEQAFCFLAPLGPRALEQCLLLGRELRALGVPAEVDGRGVSLKSMLRRADSLRARWCLLLGDDELGRGVIKVKDLFLHQQEELGLNQVARVISERLVAGSRDERCV